MEDLVEKQEKEEEQMREKIKERLKEKKCPLPKLGNTYHLEDKCIDCILNIKEEIEFT